MKKPSKKTKPIKTMIAQVPKHPLFDLSFEKQDENAKIVVALQSLQQNPGWLFLTQIFKENSRYLENQIITKTGEDGKELAEGQVDLLRFKNAYLKELMEKPEGFIKKLTATEEKRDELDPYEQSERA